MRHALPSPQLDMCREAAQGHACTVGKRFPLACEVSPYCPRYRAQLGPYRSLPCGERLPRAENRQLGLD